MSTSSAPPSSTSNSDSNSRSTSPTSEASSGVYFVPYASYSDPPLPPPNDPGFKDAYYARLQICAQRFSEEMDMLADYCATAKKWKGMDKQKRDMVIASGLRYLKFDPYIDYKKLDGLVASVITSALTEITRPPKGQPNKAAAIANRGGNSLLKRAVGNSTVARDPNSVSGSLAPGGCISPHANGPGGARRSPLAD